MRSTSLAPSLLAHADTALLCLSVCARGWLFSAALLRFVEQLNLPGTAASDAVEALVELPDQLLSITRGISRGTSAVEDNFNEARLWCYSWLFRLACMPACMHAGAASPLA